LIVCSFSLLAALEMPASEVDAAHSAFLMGISNAQPGPAEVLGRELIAGLQAYFDLVNTAGGIRGRKIRLLLKNDGYEPEPALNNTNELITKDKVFFSTMLERRP
jgi:branched-chain amino acid transport system substrate-binding protein